MMRVTKRPGANDATYLDPFLGDQHPTPYPITVDATALTAAEVDAAGTLKPGVPFQFTVPGGPGGLISGAGQKVFGITRFPQKIAASNSDADLTSAGAAVPVVVFQQGVVSRASIEEMLGRVLSANEVAAFAAAGGGNLILGA